MSKRPTVRSTWNEYRRMVLPATAPAIQLQECRRAFYAGAEMLMVAIMAGLDPGPGATPSDLDYLTELHQELLAFAQEVQEGRA